MKKLLAIAFCGMLGMTLTAPVHAAEDPINAVEQQLLNYLEQGMTVEGETLAFPQGSEEYESLKELLSIDGIDLTESDLEIIKTSAKDFQNFLSVHYYDEISAELLNEMMDILNPASQVFGLKLGYDAVNDALNVYDMDGNIIYSQEDIMGTPVAPVEPDVPAENVPVTGDKLENTGDSYIQTFAVIGSLCVMMIVSGYAINKKNKTEMA